MMGVGKSTLGKILSLKLDSKFIDIDTLIEKREKMSIQNIFRKKMQAILERLKKKLL